MKTTKRLFAGFSAMALAASCFAMSASALKLNDIVHPTEDDDEMNDAYYSIGAMGFYMNRSWSWNQGDWVGIDDEGKITIELSINEIMTDTTLSGKGTLGSMGVMVCNLPDDAYGCDVKITDAKFVDNDGKETVLDSVMAITTADENKYESGFRVIIRPDDEVDEDSGEVKCAATPEVAGWEEEGAFKGGTLSMVLDFGPIDAAGGEDSSEADDSKEDESKADDSKADESKADESSKASTTTTTTTTSKTTTTATTSTTASDATENTDTGAAAVTLSTAAIAAAAIVVARKRK